MASYQKILYILLESNKAGCVLSPLLFNLFINDIVSFVQKESIGVSVGETFIFILLYADDIALLAEKETDLQYMIDKLYSFCQESKMTVNISKTQWLIFEQKTSQTTLGISMTYSEKVIEKVNVLKYLGIFFDNKLTFSYQVKYVLIKADKAASLFWQYSI